MNPAFTLSAMTALVALGLAAVAVRRSPSPLHWSFFALALSVAVWSAGLGARALALAPEWHPALLRIAFFGMMSFPGLWLLLASRLVPPSGALRVTPGWVLLPSALTYVAFLSNGAHHAVIRDALDTEPGLRSWAGPLLWVFFVWAVFCIGTVATWMAAAAERLLRGGARGHAVALMSAGLLPIGAVASMALDVVPRHDPLAPAAMAGSMLALAISAMRYEIVERVPLAHRDVIRSLRQAVLVADAGGLLIECNPATSTLLGTQPRPGMRLSTLVAALAPEDAQYGVISELERLEQRSRPLRLHLETADGRRIDVGASCLRAGTGEPVGQVVVLRDRTEELRYGEIIQRTEKLETVGTMAAGVAHEINNPLAFVRANLTELARMGEQAAAAPGDSKLARSVSDLREVALETLEGITRIERVVADMRQLSGAPGDGFIPVDLNDVVRDAVRMARLRVGPAAAIWTELFEDVPWVDASAPLLVHAVLNLLINALDAVEGGADPVIRVATGVENGACVLRVADNGPGVPEGLAAQVFEPFFSTRADGTGLGLAVARDVARDHGGELVCEQARGGACFAVYLPALSRGSVA